MNAAHLCCVSLLVVAPFGAGCRDPLGFASSPTASSTPLPGSRLTVVLHGPDPKGHYSYTVETAGGAVLARRFLGGPAVRTGGRATVMEEGGGIVRLNWSDEEDPDAGAFAIFDVARPSIVRDVNGANPRDVPLEAPPAGG